MNYRHLFLFMALLSLLSCESRKNQIQSVVVTLGQFGSPYSFINVNFESNVMTCVQWRRENGDLKDTLCDTQYSFDPLLAQSLREVLSENRPDSNIWYFEEALDGGGFMIEYINASSDTTRLNVSNPKRNEKYKIDFLQLDEFFKFAYSVVKDSIGEVALDKAYQYYYDGLPIRRISEMPIHYKIWGFINGCEEDHTELVNFFDSLPKEECVIIDLRTADLSYCISGYIHNQSSRENIFIIDEKHPKWLRDELIQIRKEVREKKRLGQSGFETTRDEILLNRYLSDSIACSQWLDEPIENLNLKIDSIKKNCR